MPVAWNDLAGLDAELEHLIALSQPDRMRALEVLGRSDATRASALRRLLDASERVDTGNLRDAMFATLGPREPERPCIPGYRILRVLGSGGMATVYEAERLVGGVASPVALKLVHEKIDEDDTWERTAREQQILATLQHPNIATLLDFGTVASRPFLVMEFIRGSAIDHHFEPGEAPVRSVVEAFRQVADAVQAAHEQLVVHRDIKPENILVDPKGVPKLIDFGIARVLKPPAGMVEVVTVAGSAPLTYRYASPEQLGGLSVGVASDVYQLGLVLFRLLSGGWPYPEEAGSGTWLPVSRTRKDRSALAASAVATDPSRARSLRGDLDAILRKCLQHDPLDRYRSAAELRDDLDRYLSKRPVRARRQTRTLLLRSFVARHKLGVTVAVSAVLLGAVALSAYRLDTRRVSQQEAQAQRVLDVIASMTLQASPYEASPGALRSDVQPAGTEVPSSQGGWEDGPIDDLRIQFSHLRGILQDPGCPVGRYHEATTEMLDSLASARQRLGDSHPKVHELATRAALILIDTARFQQALDLLESFEPGALAESDAETRAYHHLTIGAAALHAGIGARALEAVLDGVELAEAAYGAGSPWMAYPLQVLAWTLFELEDYAAAARAATLSLGSGGEARPVPALVLDLAARIGVPGVEADPAFVLSLSSQCARVEHVVLSGLLSGGRPIPAGQVPEDCNAVSATRLEALGWTWNDSPVALAGRHHRSPLLLRSVGRAEVDGIPISPETSERIAALLVRVERAGSSTAPQVASRSPGRGP